MTDREKLLKLIFGARAKCHGKVCDICEYRDAAGCFENLLVDRLLANGVVIRERGEWVGWHGDRRVSDDEYGMRIYRHYHYFSCRKCGRRTAVRENFCPNCGADMRKGENG